MPGQCLTFEVDTQVGYIEYVSYVYLFQVQAYGVLRLFGYGSVDLQVTLFMAEVEIVDVHFARVDHDLRRVYLPYGVVEDYVRFLYVDNSFSGRVSLFGLGGRILCCILSLPASWEELRTN